MRENKRLLNFSFSGTTKKKKKKIDLYLTGVQVPVNVAADVNWAKLVNWLQVPETNPGVLSPVSLTLRLGGQAGGLHHDPTAQPEVNKGLTPRPTRGRGLSSGSPHTRKSGGTCVASVHLPSGCGRWQRLPPQLTCRTRGVQAPGTGRPTGPRRPFLTRRRSRLLRPGLTRSLRVASSPAFTRRH